MHNEHDHKKQNIKKLWMVLCITLLYMVAEFAGGYISNSLALMADAAHMLSDAAALGLSIFAAWLTMKPATFERTFGYHRTEIFAAFINGVMLFAIAGFIVYEAINRIANPPDINALVLIFVALGGLVVNIVAARILHSSDEQNLNIKGAYLHVLGDMLGSFGAIVAGLAIYFFDYHLLDPIISFVIAALILVSAIRLISETVNILLEASPAGVNVESIHQALLCIQDVIEVHHLHVWSITSGKVSLSVHLVTTNPDFQSVLCDAQKMLKEDFDIDHVTIQVESPGYCDGEASF